MKKFLGVLAVLLFVTGCATTTVGKKIDMDKVVQIQEGVTTEDEAISLLGNPWQKSLTENGKVVLIYVYSQVKQKFITSDIQQDTVTILIGKDGKVEKYVKNSGTIPVKRM